MKRIVVIGNGGSGKTSLSNRLAAKLELPVYYLDSVFWGPNWKPVERSEYLDEVTRIVNTDSWVIDGNYSSSFDLRFPKADTIIFLDLSPLLCLFRVVRRRIKYAGQTRPSMTDGNNERLTWAFVSYVLGYSLTRRPSILKRLELIDHARVEVLRSNSDIDQFINDR